MILKRLKRLNKEEVTVEDVQEAQNELRERLQAEEDKRKEEEQKKREEEEDRLRQ